MHDAHPTIRSRAPIDDLLDQICWWPDGHYRPIGPEQWESHCPACGGSYQLTLHELLPDGPVSLRCATGCDPAHVALLLAALERLHRAQDELLRLGAWDPERRLPIPAQSCRGTA